MGFLKKTLLCGLLCGSALTGMHAAPEQDSSRFDEELNERDFDALRDYLKQKRSIEIEENTLSNLTFSGDVRTEWRHLNEHCRGQSLRGKGAVDLGGRPISRNDFDIEFNLRLDYICDRTWAVAHVRYDNSAGVDDNDHPCGFFERMVRKPKKKSHKKEVKDALAVNEQAPANDPDEPTDDKCMETARECGDDPEGYHGSGRCNDLCLKKAYFGYSICKKPMYRLDVEVGRRGQLYNVFDSNIEFLSRFDGIFLKYQKSQENCGDWYVQGAGFVVDERVNHLAWAMETGWLNLMDSSFDLKYSFIDWEKHGRNRCFVQNPRGFRFMVSQWLVAYHLDPSYLYVPVKCYAAFLWNSAAQKLGHKQGLLHNAGLQNIGWYVGVLAGKVVKGGDWAVELQYQVVQAQAMPDDDCAGICRGNVLDESFTTCSHRGNTNFQGWKLEGLYAVTDNLTLDSILEASTAYDSRIGGSHRYRKFELEAIYAF